METSVSREIDASAARVWEVITDLEGSPRVLSGVEKVERIDAARSFGVGTRWRETRTLFGKQATEEMAVTAVDPGRSYTVEADSRGARYTSILAVEPLDEHRSKLSMSFQGAPTGLVGKVLAATVGRLFQPATRKQLRRDLDDIAAHVEGPPGGLP